MKAISLWQPWASLIACGAKPYETRHWAPPWELIGQTIAIHAAKHKDKGTAEFADEIVYGRAYGDDIAERFTHFEVDNPAIGTLGHVALPMGAIVCLARLDAAFWLGEAAEGTAFPAACVVRQRVSRPMPPCFTVRYDAFGDYAAGRWAWLLTQVQPLRRPIAMVGHQGFFDLPQGWLCP